MTTPDRAPLQRGSSSRRGARRRAFGRGLIAGLVTLFVALFVVGLGVPGRARAAEPVAAAPGPPAPPVAVEGPRPMHPAAQVLYDRALAEFGRRDYPTALRDLDAAFAIDPRRELLFAEAQAKRLSGDCRGAVVLYQRFLTTQPPAVQVEATQIALARCAQELARKPEVVIMTSPPPPPPKPEPVRWTRDPWGLALAGAGIAGLGVGVGWLIAASRARGDAESAPTYAGYVDHWSTASGRADVAAAALAIGGALVVTGMVRLLLVRRHARREAAALWLGLGGVGGTF